MTSRPDGDLVGSLPPLPDRNGSVVAGLPASFSASSIDYIPGSVAWWKGRWIASTNAWGGRKLATADAKLGWQALPAPEGWTRRPMVSDDGTSLACMVHEPAADYAALHVLSCGQWTSRRERIDPASIGDWDGIRTALRHGQQDAAIDALGRIISVRSSALVCGTSDDSWSLPLPPKSTAILVSASPSRELVLVILRASSSYHAHVFQTSDGRSAGRFSCHEVLHPLAAWVDERRVILVREAWPSLEPVAWDWASGASDPVWPAGTVGTVRSLARAETGAVACAVSSFDSARSLASIDTPPAPGTSARPVVVHNDDQLVPCLVHDPQGPIRATCLVFPGGPHEPVWAEHAPVADALTASGWRVVRVNTRSSGLRESRFRPNSAYRYGVDDVADACAAWDQLAVGPVVTLGMSYGAYVASLAADRRATSAAGVVVLAGFVSPRDLARSEHAGVREFASAAFGSAMNGPARRLTVPHFFGHGALDRRIPLGDLRPYCGSQTTFVVLPDEGHGIHSDSAAVAVYPQMFRWMEERVS